MKPGSRRTAPVLRNGTYAALCLVLYFAARAQAADMTIPAFLTTAKEDARLSGADERTEFLLRSSANTPFFEKIEFRTETDEFKASRQTYRVRAYPNGWGKTKAEQDEYNATVNSSKQHRDLLVHRALKKRYLLVIDFLHIRSALELNRRLREVYGDRMTVMKKSAGTPGFDITDLLKAAERYAQQQLYVIELENNLSFIENAIFKYAPAQDSIVFDVAGLPGIEQIRTALPDPAQAPDKNNIYLQESSLSLEIARSRYEQEQSESSRLISFLELSYDNQERHDTQEAVAVQLGIRLPFINANRLAMNRKKLRYLDAKEHYEELRLSLAEQLALLCRQLHGLLEQCRVLEAASAGMEASAATLSQAAGAEPLTLLQIKEGGLKSSISLTEIRQKIYTSYIEVLDVTGKLSEKPLRNHLSSALGELDS